MAKYRIPIVVEVDSADELGYVADVIEAGNRTKYRSAAVDRIVLQIARQLRTPSLRKRLGLPEGAG